MILSTSVRCLCRRLHLRSLVLCVLACALLVGCNSTPKRDPDFSAVAPADLPPVPTGNGAIYQAGFERSWFENVRARRAGDILLVNLVEDTEASHTNSASVSRDTNASVTAPTLFGRGLSFGLPGQNGSYNLSQSLGSASDFSGDADNTQNAQFNGSVSVMVTEVLPNGYLRVRGEKRISMTGGNEYIRVAGIVRPEDINTSNEIDSTRIADATLVYVGDGQVAKAATMGWLAKFFISALFPF